jgi:hypothetical protein
VVFGIFRMHGKIIRVEKNHCCPKLLDTLENFMLPDNFGHLIKVEESFHFCPNLLGILENPRHQKPYWAIWEFLRCPIILS